MTNADRLPASKHLSDAAAEACEALDNAPSVELTADDYNRMAAEDAAFAGWACGDELPW